MSDNDISESTVQSSSPYAVVTPGPLQTLDGDRDPDTSRVSTNDQSADIPTPPAASDTHMPANAGEYPHLAGNETGTAVDAGTPAVPDIDEASSLPSVDPATTPHTPITDSIDTPKAAMDVMDWLANTLAKPVASDLAEMMRWTEQVMIEEAITEYQMRWMSRARPVLDKIDSAPNVVNALQTKRTILLVVAADYLHKPRQRVFELEGTAGRAAWDRWMKRPHIRAVYDEVYSIMADEVLEHEMHEIRKANRITRISASRASEVRAELLDHPNAWVRLQSARDIMQSADRSTAAFANQPASDQAASGLTPAQLDQLMQHAAKQLSQWDDAAAEAYERPVILVDPPPSIASGDDESTV